MDNIAVKINKTSLPLIALSMLAGVTLLQSQPVLNGPLWTAAESCLLIPIFLGLFAIKPSWRIILTFLLAYLWALLLAHSYMRQQLPENLAGQDILLQGVVQGVPIRSGAAVRFDFQVTGRLLNGQNTRFPSQSLRLSWYYHFAPLHSGDEWQLMVRLKQPHGMQNPGGFDYEQWLYQKAINATGYVRKSDKNSLLGHQNSGINGLREHLFGIISRLEQTQYQGLLQALTVGLKSGISPEQWKVLRQTGTSHLMAISGLHIGLVAGLVFFMGRKFAPTTILTRYSASQFAALVSLCFAGFYALLAGFSVPTQRAFIMLLVFMLALMLKRPAFSLNTLSLALIGVLVFSPTSILSPGFWLSFSAVFIISLLSSFRLPTRKDMRLEPKTKQNNISFISSVYTALLLWIPNVLQGLKVQWGIAIGMMPLSLIIFQQGALISPLANMLVIPLVGFLIVPLVLIAGLISLISVNLSSWIFSMASHLLGLIWQLLEWLAHIPMSGLSSASIPWLESLLAILGSLLLLMPKGFPIKLCGVILILPMVLYQAPRPEMGEIWLSVLDVGQGLSVLLQTQSKNLLYDTGARFSQSFDVGQRVVLPLLTYKGIEQLDMMVLSHADNDHAGGAGAILSNIKVSKLLGESEAISPHTSSIEWSEVCATGQHWQWDGVNFEILHPGVNARGHNSDNISASYKKANNRSCVLKVWNSQYSLLLSGDIEAKVERQLLAQSADYLQSDVLIAPHHGSNTSSTRAFLKAVKAHWVIVSAGFHNRFGHPTQKVLKRYKQQGSVVLNTAYEGEIEFKFANTPPKSQLNPQSQRKQRVHYWNHRF